MEEWRLTKEEEAKVIAAGKSMSAAQAAKKWAYREAGRTILNPDALDGLYEGLEDALREICRMCVRLNPQHENCTSCEEMERSRLPLSKAEGKDV